MYGMNNEVFQVTEIKDPKLREIGDSIVDLMKLGIKKAIAYEADPRTYKLSEDQTAFENIFFKYFKSLADAEQKETIDKVIVDIQTKPYDTLHPNTVLTKVDLKAATSIEAQAIAIDPNYIKRISVSELKQAIITQNPNLIITDRGFVPHQSPSNIKLLLTNVYCETETGLTSYGHDSMRLAGVTLGPLGDTTTFGVIDLGQYDSGTNQSFSTELANLGLNGQGWPREFFATLVPANKVVGGLWEYVEKIWQKVKEYVVTAITTVYGAAIGATIGSTIPGIGTFIGGLVGSAIGYLVGYICDTLWGWYKDWATGHIFKPVTIGTTIGCYNSLFSGSSVSPVQSVWWTGAHGKYWMNFNWKLSWGDSNVVTAASRQPDLVDIFTVDNASVIKTAAHKNGGTWHGWWQICNGNTSGDSPITAISRGPNKLDILSVGFDGKINHAGWYGDGWKGWWPVAGGQAVLGTQVGAVSRAPNLLDAFHVGNDGNIYTAAWDENTDKMGVWRGWWHVANGKGLPGSLVSAASRGSDHLDIFVTGLDGHVWTAAWGPQTNGKWAGWWQILNLQVPFGAPISAVSRAPDWLDIFVTGSDGGIYSASYNASSKDGWHGWWQIQQDKAKPGSQIAALSRGHNSLDIFVVGENNRIFSAGWQGKDWVGGYVGDENFRVAPGTQVSAVAKDKDHIDVFAIGTDGRVWTSSGRGYCLKITEPPLMMTKTPKTTETPLITKTKIPQIIRIPQPISIQSWSSWTPITL